MSLTGRRVLVTRAEGQASVLAESLRTLGAEPWVLPAIEIVPATDEAPAHAAIRQLDAYDWVIFTSANAVRAWDRLTAGRTLPSPPMLAAVGPNTAIEVERVWRRPDVIPSTFRAAELLPALGDVRGKSFLLPRGDLAGDDLPRALTDAGARHITSVEVYRTVAAPWPAEIQGTPDIITFTSSSGVLATHERLAERGLLRWLGEVPCVCIGPITATTLQDLRVTPAEVADCHTIPGLVAAVERVAARMSAP